MKKGEHLLHNDFSGSFSSLSLWLLLPLVVKSLSSMRAIEKENGDYEQNA